MKLFTKASDVHVWIKGHTIGVALSKHATYIWKISPLNVSHARFERWGCVSNISRSSAQYLHPPAGVRLQTDVDWCLNWVFFISEPAYFIESLEPMEVTAGDAVCLKCQVGGTPEIKVSWFKADGKVRSSPTCRLEYTKGVACLKLSKATKADIGEYTCKAENRIGSASSTCRLSVLGEHLIFL